MAVYIRELKEEFSKGLILPTDRAKPQVITKGKSNIAHATVDKKTFQNHVSFFFLEIFFFIFFSRNFSAS